MKIGQILLEIGAGALGKAPNKVTNDLPELQPLGVKAASEDEEEEEALESMKSQLPHPQLALPSGAKTLPMVHHMYVLYYISVVLYYTLQKVLC